MIKFFRKIRYDLIEKNTTSAKASAGAKTGRPAFAAGRYFKYAIGEIALVIIGILIALQVNNFNEERKVGNEMKTKIQALATNLADEIRVSGVQFHTSQIQKTQKILNNEISLDNSMAEQDYINVMNFRFRLKDDILEETIDILIDNEDRLPKRYKEIVPLMKSLKFYFSNYKSMVADLGELKRNNEKILENNFTWYASNDSISNKERIRYYATDPLFKNRLFTIQQKYRDAFYNYSATIVIKLEIIYAIKKADENYSVKDFGSYLSAFTFVDNTDGFFNRGKKVSCDERNTSNLAVRSDHLVLNASSDTIMIDNKPNWTIPPKGSFRVSTTSENNIISVYRNNSCEAYQVTPYNYIIIE